MLALCLTAEVCTHVGDTVTQQAIWIWGMCMPRYEGVKEIFNIHDTRRAQVRHISSISWLVANVVQTFEQAGQANSLFLAWLSFRL